MAPWILWSLLAAAATAVVTILDKTVLSKWMVSPMGSYFVYGAIEGLSGLIAFFALGAPRLPLGAMLLALLTGAAFSFSTLCYFEAIKVEEVTRVVPMYNLTPILTALFAAVFLGEVLSAGKYIGVLLLIAGALLLSLKRLRGFRLGKGMGWMLLAVALIAVTAIVSKYLLASVDPWALFAYGKFGTLLATIPTWGRGFPAFRQAVRKHAAAVLAFTLMSEALTAITTIFFLYAAATGYVTLVGALIGVHPLFLLLFTVLLSLYRPDVLKEELGGRLLLRKAIGIILMLAGAGLIT